MKRTQRATRFGLTEDEVGGAKTGGELVGKREVRAKRFGMKLVAYKGEPVALVDKYVDYWTWLLSVLREFVATGYQMCLMVIFDMK